MKDYPGIYHKLYGFLESTGPMLFDCGLLCRNACCADNGLGMLLFPGEEIYLDSLGHEFKVTESGFKVDGIAAKLLFCNGTCSRVIRPLSCRIFPLFPFYREGRITIDFDPRANGTCPLLYKDIEGIYTRGLFRLKVLMTAYEMVSHPPLEAFLESYTREIDTISRFRL